ncbi:MAG: metal transporter [Desulfosarcinaceae bacterium]|nr:metal transporter [Desulfosarcinaceae bacterium]
MAASQQYPSEHRGTAEEVRDGLSILMDLFTATQSYAAGMSRYTTDFFIPFLLSSHYFQRTEADRMLAATPANTYKSYLGLLDNNIELMDRSLDGASKMLMAYAQVGLDAFNAAWDQSCADKTPAALAGYFRRQAELMDQIAHGYPEAIAAIAPEFGFHFERGEHVLLDETDRFRLYRVAPTLKGVQLRSDAKPILILPPYVLGANILAFLPGEQRSYAHSFANQGFPTYIRVLKEIDTTPALQTMTGEDDALDTRRFCEAILKAHGQPITLNGYCQGGFNALCNLLSGQLDGLVDAFITCVSPMDGTRSKGLSRFLHRLPPRFNDLDYGTKRLPNGNRVADGQLMGWVYKLKSIEHEIPAAAFFRDLMMFARQTNGNRPSDGGFEISKTAAALNYWLQNERFDLPLAITRISHASYNVPISADGTLPVRLFGKPLNLKRLKEKQIPWLICYGIHDDLVEKETALAPCDHLEVEVTPFPKGHVAIATSWSAPDSACGLHTRFGEGNYRGPVRFHMDLDAALATAAAPRKRAPKRKAAATGDKSASKTAAKQTRGGKTPGSGKGKGATAKRTRTAAKPKSAAAPSKKGRSPKR